MKQNRKQATLAVLALAGTCATVAQAQDPVRLDPSIKPVQQGGHIYYNAVTGERVVTLLGDGQTAPADTGTSIPIWAMLGQSPCADFGYPTTFFYAVDDPTGGTSLSTGIRLMDYGDIAQDSVVDCVEINWVVAHPDEWVDDNDTSLGVVGVEELAGQWIVWEVDNGRAINVSTRTPIVDLVLFNLPGNTPTNAGNGALTGWTADIDLVAFGTATDLSFELGNTDGDCQGAAFCQDFDLNSDGIPDGVGWSGVDFDFDGLPDSDIDGDGLFDWSWTVNFIQPGQGNDFDSDSDTGSLPGSNSDTIGVSFGVPPGMAIDNGDGTWDYDIDETAPGAPLGAEDRFAIYEPDGQGDFIYNGGYWFGGFACTGGLISTGGTGYTPLAMFQFVLYGPGVVGPCPADCNLDGVLNFFDISCFLTNYNNGSDYNGDGSTNFFDVSAFLTDFNAGCP